MSVGRAAGFNTQLILKVQDEQVPGVQSQCRCLGAFAQYVTKPPRTIGFALASKVQIDLQGPVFTAQVLGFRYDSARRGPGTDFGHRGSPGTSRPGEDEHP